MADMEAAVAAAANLSSIRRELKEVRQQAIALGAQLISLRRRCAVFNNRQQCLQAPGCWWRTEDHMGPMCETSLDGQEYEHAAAEQRYRDLLRQELEEQRRMVRAGVQPPPR
jgi:hypothetical protein